MFKNGDSTKLRMISLCGKQTKPMKPLRLGVLPVLGFLVITILLLTVACENTMQVKGHSMEPTFNDGDRVTIDSNAFKESAPQRGDIVIHESDRGKMIRRVIGLPGETITFERAVVNSGGRITAWEQLYVCDRCDSQRRFGLNDYPTCGRACA